MPPEIYWRRRMFAGGSLVVALAVVIWLLITAVRGDETAAPTPAASQTVTSATTDPPSSDPAAASSTAQRTSAAGRSPGAPPECSDQALAVKVTVAQPTYRLGQQPVFGIVITNVSDAACTRDMGSGLQKVTVHSLDGDDRIWASGDCAPDGAADVRTLQRGEEAAFTITWTGNTSAPGCAGERTPAPAGGYRVVAQLGSIRSAPEPFNIA